VRYTASVRRRSFLATAGLGALSGLVHAGCGPTARSLLVAPAPLRRFAPVRVSFERVTRTVVGLRPFRPSGFVVRAERAGDRVIVHNYGHGGAGVTLSWGTSHLAVEEAWTGERMRCAVVGCGAVGLATARLLQRRGAEVTIYAKDLPPNTTSNIAGAQWSPYSVADANRRTPAFDAALDRAARLSHRYFQDMVSDHYGVRWIENYALSDRPFSEGRALAELYPDSDVLQRSEHPFPFPHVRRFVTMLIEPQVYLNAVLRDFLLTGGRVVVRELGTMADLAALDEPLVFNCTGLGARTLVGDDELTPIKGQLTILLPQPEVDYITLGGGDLYMFPRRDGILLGGTHERGEWSLEPNRDAVTRIVEGHRRLFGALG
jgi:D-amino-acid oxidase